MNVRVQRGLTAALAATAARLSVHDLTAAQIERMQLALLDWVGVTIAGANDPAARATADLARAPEGGACTVVGTGVTCGPQAAALANGTAALALDFDDVSFWMRGHPSVVVAPAVLALGELRGLPGTEILSALAAGYEAAAVVGLAAGVEHYVAGWHATGTVGAVAAAAAAGRALGLDTEAMERALGLGTLQASGLKVTFGSTAKALHGGRAASAGVLAALLAEAGCTAPLGAIEAPEGFAGALAPGLDAGRPPRAMQGRRGLESIAFKEHSSCGATHATIDGVRRLLSERGLVAGDVDRVELRVTEEMLDICCIAEPATGHEGMFSVAHAAALVLTGRGTGPAGFTDAAVMDPAVVAARELVLVAAHPERPTGIRTEVAIVLRTGERLVEDLPERVPVVDAALGPLRARLQSKFRDLVVPVIGIEAADELIARTAALEREIDITGLLALSRPARASLRG